MEPSAPPRRVAHVAVDMPLAHLDRPFDYLIEPDQADDARPGAKVRVRFAGKLRDGYILDIGDSSDVTGTLAPLERVTSGEVVLTAPVARLVRAVADHWGGTFADVVRLAVPPRHATTEKARPPVRPEPDTSATAVVLPRFAGGERYLAGLSRGEPLRAVWNPVPVWGSGWADGLLDAASASLSAGRGVVVVAPDGDVVEHLRTECEARFGAGSFAVLSADAGPSVRYRNFLAVARGDVRLVIGTRAAVYAPVQNLGLVVVWDEGNDLLAEPRAPYPHAREVATLRAALEHSGLLLAGFARSAEVESLVERSWVVPLTLPAREVRRLAPVVRVAADTDTALDRDLNARTARLPHDVFTAIRAGLASGPVLLQVPRAGYTPSLACQQCRTLARCLTCAHPLQGQQRAGADRDPRTDQLAVVCPTCGPVDPWRCPVCGDARLRAPRVGVTRTAEELGRAFPQVRVITSWSGHRVEEVDAEPALVLATPGAEPDPEEGYAAAILLDTGLLLGRPDLRAAEEALRRWLGVCALVRGGADGGTVTAVGEPQARALQSLVRLDAPGFAARELAERVETRFPPAARLVTVDGAPDALADFTRAAADVAGLEEFGPVPLEDDIARLTLRVPPRQGPELVTGLKQVLAARSARKAPGAVRLQVDPTAL